MGRHRGVTGCWNIRLAIATEEKEHRLALTSIYPLEDLLHKESVKRKGTEEGTSSSRLVRGFNNDVPSSMTSTMFVALHPPCRSPPSESECYDGWNDDEDKEISI